MRKGSKTKYLVLGILDKDSQTGYGIKKLIEREHAHFWQESFGQIYPTLKKLEEDGFIVKLEEDNTGGRKQIIYSITDAGRVHLKQWLIEDIEVERLRYELFVKVAFGDSTEPEVIVKHLDEFISRTEKKSKHAKEAHEHLKQLYSHGDDHTYNEITSLGGLRFYEMMLKWARDSKDIIQERKINNKNK